MVVGMRSHFCRMSSSDTQKLWSQLVPGTENGFKLDFSKKENKLLAHITEKAEVSIFRQGWIQEFRLSLSTFGCVFLFVGPLTHSGHLSSSGDLWHCRLVILQISCPSKEHAPLSHGSSKNSRIVSHWVNWATCLS